MIIVFTEAYTTNICIIRSQMSAMKGVTLVIHSLFGAKQKDKAKMMTSHARRVENK